jgi:hypothetical protein
VFNNIEKAILFMLPTNGGQGLTILTAILLGLTLRISGSKSASESASEQVADE